jgi:hypothetical protein
MPTPLKRNIVLKVGDDGIVEGYLLVPMWHPRAVYPSTISGLLR